MDIQRGWNLLPEHALPHIAINEEDIDDYSKSIHNTPKYWGKTRYLYESNKNSYKELTDDSSISATDYVHISPSWVYLRKSTGAKVSYTMAIPDIIKLSQGWNLITTLPEFSQGRLNEGTCDVLKTFVWNPYDQTWQQLGWEGDIINNEDSIADDIKGLGLAVKVKDDCQFSTEPQQPVASGTPPSLPTDADDQYSNEELADIQDTYTNYLEQSDEWADIVKSSLNDLADYINKVNEDPANEDAELFKQLLDTRINDLEGYIDHLQEFKSFIDQNNAEIKQLGATEIDGYAADMEKLITISQDELDDRIATKTAIDTQ